MRAFPHFLFSIVLVLSLAPAALVADPRAVVVPWPDAGLLFHEGFDVPESAPGVLAESWSGYALNRPGGSGYVQPWVVPMVSSNGFNLDPQRGSIRFWFMPQDTGSGSADVRTLLTLVSVRGNPAAVWWSLASTPDGYIQLLCQNGGEAAVHLNAAFVAEPGNWNLITVCYTETNSALFLNTDLAATGPGLPAVPWEAAAATMLVVGGDVSGSRISGARGQIEELSIFSGQGRPQAMRRYPFGIDPVWGVGGYFAAYSPIAALGPITLGEKLEKQQRRLAMAAGRSVRQQTLAALSSSSIEGQVALLGAGCACITNGPVYLTNLVCYLDPNDGWTFGFTIAGGTNGVPYDILSTTSLGLGSVTDWPWNWLGQGHTCESWVFTNQPADQTFYMLGDGSDPDGDGLGTAFEYLVSHSDPNNKYTRGDQIDDWTAYMQGRNPRVPGSLPDNGAIHLQVFTPTE